MELGRGRLTKLERRVTKAEGEEGRLVLSKVLASVEATP
jgi:hypothetical protein